MMTSAGATPAYGSKRDVRSRVSFLPPLRKRQEDNTVPAYRGEVGITGRLPLTLAGRQSDSWKGPPNSKATG